jgi:hypothetical protein
MDDVSSLILGEQPKAAQPKTKNAFTEQEIDNLVKTESSKNPYAINKETKAMGYGQFTPDTLAMLHKKGIKFDPFDETQARGAIKTYLDMLVEQTGSKEKALAAYGGFKTKDPSSYVGKILSPQTTQAIQTQPIDEVSSLILGGENKPEEPKGFMAELKKPLKEMSWEGFKKESLLAPAVEYTAASLGLPGFTAEDKKAAQEKLLEKGKSALKGAEQFIRHPIETAKAIGTEVVEHPGRVLGETIKGTIYDPELAFAPVGAAVKPAEKLISKAGTAAKELGEQFAKKETTMAGVGAAEVGIVKNRIERAKELPIPIELSKDQATRNPADVRFARETAKDPVLGQALQEKYASDNAKIQQNLDKFIENTGSEFSGAGNAEIGKMLAETVSKAKTARKAEIEPAYTAAREAGQMSELLKVKDLQDFVNNNLSAAKNAPILSGLNSEIKRLSKGGQISINDLEEIRKMAGVLAQSSGPDAYYGRKAIKIMDKMIEGKGGDLYKEARRINTEYMKEFENTPVIRDITAMKPGTTQRAVAIENLVDKSLINSPGDNVKQLFASLEKMGTEGQTITKELRGAVAQKIKDEATKGVQLDINGKPYVSTKALNDIIAKLDKSGKLEFIFGKKGAEQYRTLNDVTKDLQTVPVGTTNPSGTASSILAALGEMGVQTAVSGVPVPVVAIGKHLYGKHQTKKKLSKISEFVNYGKEQ